MNKSMALADVYRNLEDKYYEFIDWLDEKGLNLYPAIDKIEDRGWPSFPFAVAFVVIILALLLFGLSMLFVQNAPITFTVSAADTGTALEGATITVTNAAGLSASAATNAEGKAVLNAPLGEATAEVSKEGYEDETVSLTVSGALEKSVELERGVHMLNKTIQLMKNGTNQLLEKDVTLRFTCSATEASDFEEVKSTSNGTIELEAPSNCGSLIAAPVSGFTIPSGEGIIDLENASPQLFLQEIETNTGTVIATVENKAGQALSGVTVMAYSQDGILQATQYTSQAGTATLESIPTGTYYVVVHDSQGRYADFDSSMLGDQGLKELVKDATVSFDVKLNEATVGKIRVVLSESVSGQPVESATVYLKKEGAVLDTEYSSADGYLEFNVPETATYELEIDADGYLIAVEKNITPGETSHKVYLEPATADNTNALTVEVLDTRGKPIDNVRLVLKKADGTIYANNVVTGADGEGEFTNLPLDTYYVYAVKKGFEGKNSDPVTLKARQENKATVVLPIGFGNIEVVVLNDEMQPVQGAVVEAMNAVEEEKEQEEITNLEGRTVFNFRADKKVYFKVDAEGFLPYYSIAVMPDADSTVTVEVLLAKDPGKLEVQFVGLYKDGEKASKELAPGHKYKARLLLLVPKDSRFDEAGVHLRAGESDDDRTNIMEADSIYLRDASASTANLLRGTSYTPPMGYAIDSTHLTTGDSKWLNAEWKNVSQGAYALETEVQVRDSATLGQLLYIYYRGWGKTGNYARFPADAALGGTEASSRKQALYANAKQAVYTAGPSNLCGISFCKTIGIEDLEKNIKVSVANNYNAKIGNRYRLSFLISSIAAQAFTDAEIEIGSKTDGLRFGDYVVTDATGIRSEGTVGGYLLAKEIGDMRQDSSVFGSVEFKAEKEGSNILTIVIKSNNQVVFTTTINVRVEAADTLNIDMIPKEIIPMIDNQVVLRVTDENGETVSNAIVTVKLDDEVILIKESNGSGEVEFKLEAPATGSTLYIKAEKTGYKPAELETAIDESILRVTPPEIRQKLDPASNEAEVQVWIDNQTVTNLVLSKLRFSKDFEELVEFDWEEDYVGSELPADSDINTWLEIRLTQKGMLVQKPVKLEGALSIYALSPELQDTFVENVPIEIRIGLGGEVDDDKCLEIEPVKWEFVAASDETVSEEFTIRNNCVVENEPIALSDFSLKVDTGRDNNSGAFAISSEDLGIERTEIKKEYRIASDVLPAEFEGTVNLEYKPASGVVSAKAKQEIDFRASHATTKGEEKISTELPVEFSVSNLKRCVEIVADEPIEVETMPFNIGYGNYGGSYNPYFSGGYGGYMSGGTGYSSTGGGGYMGGSVYPHPNFTSPYHTNYFDRDTDDDWRYGLGESSFIVKNNCSSAVEIDLDVPPKIRVDEDNFDLGPDEDMTVTVESGYRMGKYELGVHAKVKDSEDKLQKIDSLDVVVRRAGEMDEECIQLSSTKIKFNNFIGKPVENRIYNYCYDVGVRLPKEGKVIQFRCRVPGQPANTYRFAEKEEKIAELQAGHPPNSAAIASQYGYNNPFAQPSSHYNQGPNPGLYSPGEGYAPTGPWGSAYGQGGLAQQGYHYPASQYPYGSSGWANQDVGNYGGECEMIDDVYVTDATTTGDPDGKTIQTVTYEVKPAIQYRKMMCQFMGNLPFQTIFGLRAMISEAYYRVEVRASANVRYYNPFGGADTKYFNVTLEDLWGIGDTIDACMANAMNQKCQVQGDPRATGETCINKNALNFTGKFGSTKGFVPQALFVNNIVELIPEPEVMDIAPGSCGARDSLELLTSSYTDPTSNVTVFFEPIETDCVMFKSAWNIKATVNRNGMNYVQCAKIDTTIRARVKKASGAGLQAGQTKDVLIPVSILVPYPGLNENELDPNKCVSLNTVPGTDTPLWDYTPSDLDVEECDEGITGKGAYKKLGFDRLPFTWDWDDIQKLSCDETEEGNKFCDAVQFSIALNKKANDLKEFVEDNKSKLVEDNKDELKAVLCEPNPDELKSVGQKATCNTTTGAQEQFDEYQHKETGTKYLQGKDKVWCTWENSTYKPIDYSCLDEYKNSKELWRWVKKQFIVSDEAVETTKQDQYLTKDLVFFLDSGENVLLDQKLKFSDAAIEKAGEIKPVDPANDAQAIVERMKALLEILETVPESDAILAEIRPWNGLAGTSGEWLLKDLGAEKKPPMDSYYMTFNEFRFFHESIKKALSEYDNPERPCLNKAGNQAVSQEEAYTCPIRVLDGSTNLINAGFLKDILTNISFKVGALHSKETRPELKEQVIEGGKNIVPIPDGKSFKEFYAENVEFKAFLVKDGYSRALRQDFYSYYSSQLGTGAKQDLEEAGYNSGNWAFDVGQGAKESVVLPKAGKYDVLLNMDFRNSNANDWAWVGEFGKDPVALPELGGEDTEYENNYFFELPFDGEVGEGRERDGYGLAFTGELAPYLEHDEGQGTGFVNASQGFGSESKKAFAYGKEFASTKAGDILNAGKTSFEFNPSVAAKIDLALAGRTSGTEGILYELTSAVPTDSIVQWFKPDGTTRNDAKIDVASATSLCPEVGSQFYGFREDISNTQNYKGLVFVPFEESYALRIICVQGSATIEAMRKETIPAGYRAAGATSYQVKLNEAGNTKESSLKSYVDRIKENQVCVIPGSSGIELLWHKGKALEGFAQKPEPEEDEE